MSIKKGDRVRLKPQHRGEYDLSLSISYTVDRLANIDGELCISLEKGSFPFLDCAIDIWVPAQFFYKEETHEQPCED